MLLTRFTIDQLGPFRKPISLELDPKVTIITGANDAGKTSVLRALRIFLTGEAASEKDINRDKLQAMPGSWRTDTSYVITGEFSALNREDLVGFGNELKGEWIATVRHQPSPNNGSVHHVIRGGGREWASPHYSIHIPACVAIGLDRDDEEIRSTIPLDKPNKLELWLLSTAFGGTFSHAKFKAMSVELWDDMVSQAEIRINELLKRVVPNSDYFKLRFRPDDQCTKMTVTIRDAQRAVTPLQYRGSGARKLIQILIRLLVDGQGTHHRLVLVDEPENSLHADSQHLLREFLFDLCADGKTQVVYATHSPAMINSMRPLQVRLVERQRIDDVATTVLRPRPDELGFSAVRSTLGVTVADSLLFAPVTVVVEGITETHCLPAMCLKLAAAKVQGFDQIEKLLGLATFLDARGQNIAVVVRFALLLGTKVVAFVDGNSPDIVAKLREHLQDSQLIRLADGNEFEDLVPLSHYLRAVAELMGTPDVDLKALYDEWCDANPDTSKYALTKRIKKWLTSYAPGKNLLDASRKQAVMAKAVSLVPAEEINSAPVLRMLEAIRDQLAGTSF